MKIKLNGSQTPNDDLFLTREDTTVGVMDRLLECITSVKTVNGNDLVGTGDIVVQSDWGAVSGSSVILNKPQIPTGKVLYYNATTGLLKSSSYNLTFTESLADLDYVICYFRASANNSGDTYAIPAVTCIINLDTNTKYGSGEFCGGCQTPYTNDKNRYAAYSCMISSDKTQFRVVYQQSLYGTGATDISDASHGVYCYKIVGYTNRLLEEGSSGTGSMNIPTKLSDLYNDVGYTTNEGTINGITMNGSSVGTTGTVDLGSVVTSVKTINNQSITGTGNLTINELPSVSTGDNGKTLIVVDGQWSLVSPSTLYSGSGTPSNSMGNNGDIYVQS